MNIPYFFGAAAGGFVLMATVGIQALVALFSSIPLAKRRHLENPSFDLKRAHRRIAQVTVLTVALVALASVLVIQFAPLSATAGYLFGMILAFVLSLKRMTPNNEQNQTNFAEAYADCYPAGGDSLDDTVSFSAIPQEKEK